MVIDKADQVMSWYVRLRDGACVRCGKPVELNDKGLPSNLSNSHYFGRTKEGTRYEPDNCDTLCYADHRLWETEDREAYRDFKIKQLGKARYDSLCIQARTYCKKDRAMSLIVARELLKTVLPLT